jgi:glycosyltransferase involved in cell wall biosynthesis
MKVLVCFENGCSGETIANKNIIKELKQVNGLKIASYSFNPLKHSSFFGYFFWVVSSVFYWIIIIAKSKQPMVIYTSSFVAALAAATLKPFNKCGLLFHYRGSRVPPVMKNINLVRKVSQTIKYEAALFLHKVFLRQCDYIIFASKYAQNSFLKQFPFLKKEKLRIIENGVELVKFRSSAKWDRLATQDYKNITYVGTLEQRKNLLLLVKALSILRKNKSKVRLKIVHIKTRNFEELKYKNMLIKKAEMLKLEKYISYIEEPRNLRKYYVESDLVVVPSKSETFGNVMFEAFAARQLFAGSPTGAMKEYLTRIDTRLILDVRSALGLASSIQRILSLPINTKRKIINKEHRFVRQYTWKRTAIKIINLAKSVSPGL